MTIREDMFLKISEDAQGALVAAARDRSKVMGYTHNFYKYPARFSPVFVRAAIQALTKPGELVLDPHVGGGTTLVEAIATGRESIGIDISTLAAFVSKVKTTIFSEDELAKLELWSNRVVHSVDIHKATKRIKKYEALGYYKHLSHPLRWRLRKAIEQSLVSAIALKTPRLVDFGRCVVLRTAQWALDGRRTKPTTEQFRSTLSRTAQDMIEGARELRQSSLSQRVCPAQVFCRSAAGMEHDKKLKINKAPRLVITSPPYPGVHVLYHRWQVDGGKEVSLPFMIAGQLDGSGSSYYTMGDRKNLALNTYFQTIKSTMSSVVALADSDTIFVQMVAFSEPSWQLPRYLSVADDLGLQERFLKPLRNIGDGRLWRIVPNRKWHANQKGNTSGCQEVVLFHRLA